MQQANSHSLDDSKQGDMCWIPYWVIWLSVMAMRSPVLMTYSRAQALRCI